MRTCNPRKLLYMLAVIMVILSSSLADAEPQMRLAVVNITDTPDLSQQSGIIAGNFTGALAKSEAFALAEREELDLVMREQKINASQLDTPESAGRIGRLMSCEYVLLLSLTYNNSPVASVRIIEVPTSKIVFSGTEITDTSDASSVNAAGSRLANDVLEVLAGEHAVITEIGDKEVTINRGSSSGVRNGDIYRVYMGTSRNNVNLAVIRVKDVRTGFSSAEIMKNGGYISALRRTDKIEAVSQKEAKALIARKKFARKRPGDKEAENPTASAVNNLDGSLGEYADFLARYRVSADIFRERYKDVLKSNNPVEMNEAGMAWGELGMEVLKFKNTNPLNDADMRIDAVRIGLDFDAQARIKQREESLASFANTIFKLAASYFRTAARLGNPDALDNLGGLYLNGMGVETDYAKAAELFTKAAEQGHAEAMCDLGVMHIYGLSVDKDPTKAIELLSNAIEKGYKGGKGRTCPYSYLGYLYSEGLGVSKDYSMAVSLLQKADELDDAFGQTLLGAMYANGHGVPQDFRKAIELYRKAWAQGYSQAKELLNELGAN